MNNEQKEKKNSDAKIRANAKYNKKNYKNLSIKIKPDQAEKIRDTASRHHLSLAQLIVKSVIEYDTNHQPQHQPQQEHTETQTADTQTAGDTTTENKTDTTTNGDTDTGENDFDWIDELYKQGKTEQREKNNS